MEIFVENTSILDAFNWENKVSVPLGEKKNIKVDHTVVITLFL